MLFFSRRWLCPGAISWTLWWKCWISGKDIWCNSCPFKLSSLYSFWWFICECKFDHSSQLSQWNLPLWHRRGTKKKSESPTGIEPMTSQTPGKFSIHWATWGCGTTKKFESLTGIKPMTSWTLAGRSIYWTTWTHEEQGHFSESPWVHVA